MKRLKFKKPFNGMDNAKKLIPESYKVDGKEFEMTDGIETYRIKWESSINEATVLMSSNKNFISEDMQKMKHLMGFKSEDTLGTLKGSERLDENKKFGDVWNKTKKLINEEVDESIVYSTSTLEPKKDQSDFIKNRKVKPKYYGFEILGNPEPGGHVEVNYAPFTYNDSAFYDYDEFIKKYPGALEYFEHFGNNTPEGESISGSFKIPYPEDESIEEGEHIKSGMGGSNKGKSRTDKTEVLKNKSKKQRRKADKEATKDINENDVEALQSALGDSPKVAAAAKKVNTRDEKFEAAIAYINNMVGDNDVLKSKIARTLLKKDDVSELENPELADLNKDGELSSYEKKRGSAIEKAMNEFDGDEDEYEYYRRGGRELDDYLDDAEKEAKKAKESGIFKDDLPPGPSDEEEQAAQVYEDDLPIPPGPSDEEEQAAQVYEDRFDEVFEGVYEEDDIETLDEDIDESE